jgi:hypothetical protein
VKYEAYHAAIDEGTAELSEIVGKIQQLRLRETLIEKTVEGLKALVASETEDASPDKSSSHAPIDTIPEPFVPHLHNSTTRRSNSLPVCEGCKRIERSTSMAHR